MSEHPDTRRKSLLSRINPRWNEYLTSRSGSSVVAKTSSYVVLTFMALFMILPLLWLINGSFQPAWQINSNPVVWIPREWLTVTAGDTVRQLLLWNIKGNDGKDTQVVQMGVRRYTATIDLSKVTNMQSVNRTELSDAQPEMVNGLLVNVRQWNTNGQVRDVVALAKDPKNENNLMVVDVAEVSSAFASFPLDLVNRSKVSPATISGIKLNGRSMADGRQVLALGPESELWIAGSPEVAKQATIIQSERLGEKEFMDVGQTQLAVYKIADKPEEQRFVVLAQENWQPLMEQSILDEKAFVTTDAQLSSERNRPQFNGIYMTTRKYSPPDGGAEYDVAILTPGSTEYLVIPVTEMDKLYSAPISDLIEPGSVNLGTLTYRLQNDYERNGSITPSAFVGEIQDLALIVPAETVKDAQDVNPEQLSRATRIHFNVSGYLRVLSLKLGATPFYMFFVNSGFVVLMNMLGHLISCTLVAYGFARFRAPGKNLLFLVLLGTMMIPGTIVTLPTYLIFRDMGLLGTMVPLWLRSFFGNAFLIFVMRQFFMSLPYDLDEAATLDGANRFQVLWYIILPLSKSALAMAGIFTFWWHWNSFLDPLIYISDQKYYTVTLAMNAFNQQYSRSAGYYDRILAGSVLSLLPMVILFIIAQRYFIEGIQMQGLKQ
jgi:multiple sugar transport system permease protein